MRQWMIGLTLTAWLAASATANGESGQVRLIVPWPAGGSADFVGRVLADHLGQQEGRTVFVDNRPGASGMIGSAVVARAAADVGTPLISRIPSHAIAPEIADVRPFEDVLDSFGHVSVRHPGNPDRYLIARAIAPGSVTAEDIMEFDLDSVPAEQRGRSIYMEPTWSGSSMERSTRRGL